MRLVPSLAVLLAAAAPAAASPGVRVYQSQSNAAITEGETIVPGDPAVVFAVVEDYGRWVDVFPDVAKVVVTWKQGSDAKVTLIKPDGNRDNLKFHQTAQARMVFFEDTGNEHAEV